MHDKRFPASQAERLDNPERLLWLPPAEVIGALAVHTGEAIADVGAGTGYFSLPLASAVGAAGKVYAVDGQSEMLARLKVKLSQAEFTNIELIHAEAEQTGLPAFSCDLFFLANLWHEIEDRVAVLSGSPASSQDGWANCNPRLAHGCRTRCRGRLWRIASRPLMPLERCGSPVSNGLRPPKSDSTPGSFKGRKCNDGPKECYSARHSAAYSR